MLLKFQKYLTEKKLFTSSDKILLTVSGGKDSVFMVNLFLQSNLNFGIAHCNFKLREKDSDLDEQFVKNIAIDNGILFHTVDFNTQEYAKEKGISIQMAARDMRYNWFEEIRQENKYNYIATAHHKNDIAETMLINLARGTGLSGLHGILAKKDKIIRPILCFNKKEIEQFIIKNKIGFREDKSNVDIKYVRNKIRHKVIPELEEINPSFINTVYNESIQFYDLEQILQQKIEEEKNKCSYIEGDILKVNIKALQKISPLKTYLYYFIRDFGFNSSDVDDILKGLNEQSGKIYQSGIHQLLKDREELVITSQKEKKDIEYIISSLDDINSLPISIKVETKNNNKNIKIKKSNQYAYLDLNKIQFPLLLRKWKNGDVFHPFGMKGKKKVSDFFIDNKISILNKEAAWVLEFNNQIMWIVGYRIDDYFKITPQSKSVLILKIV